MPEKALFPVTEKYIVKDKKLYPVSHSFLPFDDYWDNIEYEPMPEPSGGWQDYSNLVADMNDFEEYDPLDWGRTEDNDYPGLRANLQLSPVGLAKDILVIPTTTETPRIRLPLYEREQQYFNSNCRILVFPRGVLFSDCFAYTFWDSELRYPQLTSFQNLEYIYIYDSDNFNRYRNFNISGDDGCSLYSHAKYIYLADGISNEAAFGSEGSGIFHSPNLKSIRFPNNTIFSLAGNAQSSISLSINCNNIPSFFFNGTGIENLQINLFVSVDDDVPNREQIIKDQNALKHVCIKNVSTLDFTYCGSWGNSDCATTSNTGNELYLEQLQDILFEKITTVSELNIDDCQNVKYVKVIDSNLSVSVYNRLYNLWSNFETNTSIDPNLKLILPPTPAAPVIVDLYQYSQEGISDVIIYFPENIYLYSPSAQSVIESYALYKSDETVIVHPNNTVLWQQIQDALTALGMTDCKVFKKGIMSWNTNPAFWVALPYNSYWIIEDGKIVGLREWGQKLEKLVMPDGYDRFWTSSYNYGSPNECKTLCLNKEYNYKYFNPIDCSVDYSTYEIKSYQGFSNLTNFVADDCEICYTEDGVLCYTENIDNIILVHYPSSKQSQDYIIPSSITSLSSTAFKCCQGIENLYINENVQHIETGFCNYSTIKNIFFNLDASIIDNSTSPLLSMLPRLETITIGEGITEISGLCINCSHLKTINLPSTLTTIGKNFMRNCSYDGDIVLPEGITEIKDGAFTEILGEPRTLVIPSTVTKMSPYAIEATTLGDNGTGFHTIVFKCNLNSNYFNMAVQESMFHATLKTIVVAEGVTYFYKSNYVFDAYACQSIQDFYLPKTLGSYGITDRIFYNKDILKTATFHAPKGSYAESWVQANCTHWDNEEWTGIT